MACIAIVGEYNDYIESMLKGNGKTVTQTYYLLRDGIRDKRDVITNYYTDFSKVASTKEIIDLFLNSQLENNAIGIDEIAGIFNSYGSNQKVIKFGQKLFSQSRKYDVDVYCTWQRFNDLHIRIRAFMDIILVPLKVHADTFQDCRNTRCKKEHRILVYSSLPFRRKPIKIINPAEVGKHFDTNQIINEEISIEK